LFEPSELGLDAMHFHLIHEGGVTGDGNKKHVYVIHQLQERLFRGFRKPHQPHPWTDVGPRKTPSEASN